MTTDVIALTERMPDAWSLVAGLMAGGPDAAVSVEGDGAVIQLCDPRGRPLASVEAPMLVHTPGEVARLLGAEVNGPVWWTEVRAATAAEGADRLAGAIATRLAVRLGGSVWPPEATAPDGGAAAVTGGATASAPAAAQPAVDVLTDKVAAVIQDRPVVAMTAWLSDALRAATAGGRALQIVTPASARLSLPPRPALGGLPHRWVVRDGEGGFFDGLSGAVLRWVDGAFTATGDGAPAPVFAEATARAGGTADRQLLLSFVTRHRADRELLLGGGLEAAWRRLTGAPPAGWGTAEPAGLPWSREGLTALARARAPEPTWFVVVGRPDRPAIATLRVTRTTGGVEEDVTLALGHPAGGDVPDRGHEVAEELAVRHGLVSLLVQSRRARADLTVPAWLEAPPEPVAFAVGADDVRVVGLENARRAPLAGPPSFLGPAARPGLFFPLGDAGWDGFRRLMAHLHGLDRRGAEGSQSR
ncbi:DUF6177 family protein [Streptomyces specialis]|uniref:DUF6177 family protein n=1 Tax=Streptomyces specialis TaxID=498367 RepID=UPI00073EE789|nr:DUF6177 family protein [Streptomyces specialis]